MSISKPKDRVKLCLDSCPSETKIINAVVSATKFWVNLLHSNRLLIQGAFVGTVKGGQAQMGSNALGWGHDSFSAFCN